MGTRSLTLFFSSSLLKDPNREAKPFAVMYRQFDGYPDGHGKDLAEFLVQRQRIDGIVDETAKIAANGIGCLAAQCVAYFKTNRHLKEEDFKSEHWASAGELQIGGIYLVEYSKDGWQEYEYEVRPTEQEWTLTIYKTGEFKRLFEGSPADFLKTLESGAFAS